MKVVVNTPPAAPTPPTTYDLIGLSDEQMEILQVILGSEVSSEGFDLYAGVYKARGQREPKKRMQLARGSLGGSFTYRVVRP